jgi:hypothetical protein
MTKRILLLFAFSLLLFTPTIVAQVQPGDTIYHVSLHVGYGHNLTYGSMCNFDIDAYMPINPYFEMQANVRTSTANVHTLGVQLRPNFALPVGELYVEDRLMLRFAQRDSYRDFVHAISLGYMMQYVNVQVGMSNRIITPLPYTNHSEDGMILEPFDVVYRVEAFVRPQTSSWNISLCFSNMDNYQVERMWQPMFYLGGWYDVNEHWRVRLSGKMKLAGMFHLNAHYYGAELRVGAEYRF